jgi:hypothetical protein
MLHINHAPRTRLLLASLTLYLLAASYAAAQTPAAEDEGSEGPKPAKLFDLEDTLAVTIKAPWNDLERDERNQDPYPATIEYTDDLGNVVSLPLTVERRGIKRQEVCDFPPVKLVFEKEAVKGTTFRGQKSIKMVTHCKKGSKYEQYYIIEMLIYEMYRQLTDYSFRVRPLSVVYHDSERDRAADPRFAFLIEDDSDLAKRHDLKKLKVPTAKHTRFEPHLTSIFSLFQYMIGNVDWAAVRGPDPEECCHNVKLMAPEPPGENDWIYPVPYDFDSAGLVDAEYAAPPEGLPIRKVTQRLYRGFCWQDGTLDAARDLLLQKKSAIMGVVASESRLDSRTRRGVEDFLTESYQIIGDPKKFEKEIRSQCRGKHKTG